MTDEDLIQHLRNSKGWPTLGNAAADRIEALIAERDCAAQEARAVALQEAADLVWKRSGPTLCKEVKALLDTPAAEALERVRAEERESCAKVADNHKPQRSLLIDAGANSYWRGVDENSHSIAAAIRARGET